MLTSEDRMFAEYLDKWYLTPDGEPIVTPSSHLLPVMLRRSTQRAMLKIALAEEEKVGCRLMAWWNGAGAAQVLAHDQDAVLLEFAEGPRSLVEMCAHGRDDEATRILCEAAAQLHEPRGAPPAELVPLNEWFRSLWPAAELHQGIFQDAAGKAKELLAHPRDETVLHGDIHHGNVLDFGDRGWLAIDPKGLIGERGFDFANTFCNPEHETSIERFLPRIEIVSRHADVERSRLLKWILAYAGLSAAWTLEDGGDPTNTIEIGELARRELGRTH